MPKRKREEPPANSGGVNGAAKTRPSVQQQKASEAFTTGCTLLTRAFKPAKGFERQKLSRRRQTAVSKGEGQNVTRIDEEIEALKVRYSA